MQTLSLDQECVNSGTGLVMPVAYKKGVHKTQGEGKKERNLAMGQMDKKWPSHGTQVFFLFGL
jgi:hypothetical protein